MKKELVIPDHLSPDVDLIKKINEFLSIFKTYEYEHNVSLVLNYDEKSQAYYIICHLAADILS